MKIQIRDDTFFTLLFTDDQVTINENKDKLRQRLLEKVISHKHLQNKVYNAKDCNKE